MELEIHVQILDEAVDISLGIDDLEKGMKPSFLHPNYV